MRRPHDESTEPRAACCAQRRAVSEVDPPHMVRCSRLGYRKRRCQALPAKMGLGARQRDNIIFISIERRKVWRENRISSLRLKLEYRGLLCRHLRHRRRLHLRLERRFNQPRSKSYTKTCSLMISVATATTVGACPKNGWSHRPACWRQNDGQDFPDLIRDLTLTWGCRCRPLMVVKTPPL